MRTYISDRLPQFIIVENLPENIIDRNDDQIQHRDYKNFNTDVFKRDIGEIDWSLATGNKDVNLNFEMFLMLIFLNYHEHQCISGILRTYISASLPQFIIVENLPENIIDRNDDQIQHRDYKNFNTDVFKRDIGEIDWSLATGNKDVNLNFEMFLKLIGKNFYKNVPLKKTSGEKKKNQTLGHKGSKTFSEN